MIPGKFQHNYFPIRRGLILPGIIASGWAILGGFRGMD